MGKAKRFNSYDNTVAQQRKVIQSYGQARQDLSTKAFRSMPQEPPTINAGIFGLRGDGTGEFLTASLAADHANASATEHVEFDTKDVDGGIELQTGAGQLDGIFELLSSRKYYLEAAVRPEFAGATGVCVMVWYDRTGAAEIGSRAIYQAMDFAGNDANQPVISTLFEPTVNSDVEVRVISETGLDAFANEYTHANIFEIALGGFGAGSGGGGGGSGVTFPITPTINDHGNVGTVTEDLDLSASTGHVHKLTLTGNPTLTFSNPPSSGIQMEFEIELVQDATGGRTVTFPASVVESVTISTAASSTTILTCRTNDGGTNYHVIPALRGSITVGSDFALTTLANLGSVAINTSLISDSDNVDDLGSATFEWKDLYIDGTANIDTLAATTMSGSLTMGGNTITGLATITPDANGTRDLGTASLSWDSLWARAIRFDDDVSAPTGASPHKISTSTNGMDFNVDVATDTYRFFFNGGLGMTFTISGSTDKITCDKLDANDQLIIQDSTTDPAANGIFTNNAGDVKVFSGGSVVNLSSIGADNLGDHLATQALDLNANNLILDADADSIIAAAVDDIITISTLGTTRMTIGNSNVLFAGDIDLNGGDVIMDADADSVIRSDADDTIRIRTGGSTRISVNNTQTLFQQQVDFDANTIILDADGDSSMVASTDDNIQFSTGASARMTIANTSVLFATDITFIDGTRDIGTSVTGANNIYSDNTLFCSNFKVFTGDSDINVFNDLDMQAGDTVDFADTGSTPTGSALGAIVIKVNGVSRLVKFYST